MKTLADGYESVVTIPPVIGIVPVEVQVTLVIVLIENQVVDVTVRVLPLGAERNQRELSLKIGVGSAESQKLRKFSRAQTLLVELSKHLLGRHVAIEVHDVKFDLTTFPLIDREVSSGDVVVHPVVLSGLDHLLEGHVVVQHDFEDVDGGYTALDELLEERGEFSALEKLLILFTTDIAIRDEIHGFGDLFWGYYRHSKSSFWRPFRGPVIS